MPFRGLETRRATPPPAAIQGKYADADLVDSYVVDLAPGHPNALALTRAMMARAPWWLRGLLALRDVMVKPFGIKTAGEMRVTSGERMRIDFFPIVSVTDDEVVLGAEDMHLDFRAYPTIRRQAGMPDHFEMTTAVRCNNAIGRAYLFANTPFHKIIVRSLLARAAPPPGVISPAGRPGAPRAGRAPASGRC